MAQVPTECVIGVDLGGTNLYACAVDCDLVVHGRTARTVDGLELPALLDTIAAAVVELREGADAQIEAVGFGIPCLIDDERGVAASSVHLPIAGLAFAEAMAERVGLPVFVDNDANLGAARRVPSRLRCGCPCRARADARHRRRRRDHARRASFRGAQGAAGEIGHMIVDPDGPACGPGCPGHGCLEAWASGSALAREARIAAAREPAGALGRALAEGRDVSGPLVTELAERGDPQALAVLTALGEWLGVAVASLVNIFNPDVVVVGGGVSRPVS